MMICSICLPRHKGAAGDWSALCFWPAIAAACLLQWAPPCDRCRLPLLTTYLAMLMPTLPAEPASNAAAAAAAAAARCCCHCNGVFPVATEFRPRSDRGRRLPSQTQDRVAPAQAPLQGRGEAGRQRGGGHRRHAAGAQGEAAGGRGLCAVRSGGATGRAAPGLRGEARAVHILHPRSVPACAGSRRATRAAPRDGCAGGRSGGDRCVQLGG